MTALDPTPAVLPAARATLARHARSFRVAARLLGPAEADDLALLYALCREADDLVDEAPTPRDGAEGVAALRAELAGTRPPRALVVAFHRMALRRRLPLPAMWALVDTIAGDAGRVRVADDAALLRYAWGVAGTVGLLSAALLGARGPRAESRAVALGVAMQLTNVARDVAEDARRDRVYLPADRLRARGVDPEAVAAGTAPPEAVAAVVAGLVDLADRYYLAALGGLRDLPWRARPAVAVAASLYRAIGHAVVRRGAAAVGSRTRLGRVGLALAFLRGLASLLVPRPARDTSPDLPPTGLSGACPTG